WSGALARLGRTRTFSSSDNPPTQDSIDIQMIALISSSFLRPAPNCSRPAQGVPRGLSIRATSPVSTRDLPPGRSSKEANQAPYSPRGVRGGWTGQFVEAHPAGLGSAGEDHYDTTN